MLTYPNRRSNINSSTTQRDNEMPVFKMTKEECIAEMMVATEMNTRPKAICMQFYKITGELISSYC